MKNKKKKIFGWVIFPILIIWSIFPIFWIIITSIKSRTDIFSLVPRILFTPDFSALKTALTPGSASIYRYLGNSLYIALVGTILTLVCSIMAAYIFSRRKFRYRGLLWLIILFTRLLPPVSTIVPLFIMASKFKLIDTYLLLICINVALNVPFSIWLLKSFFDQIPVEIEEASMVDGCTSFQSVTRIVLPMAAPGVATAATFVFVQIWNEFTFASIFTATNIRTLPVLLAESRGEDIFLWQDMAVRTSIQLIPALIIGLYLQKHLVSGLTAGSIK